MNIAKANPKQNNLEKLLLEIAPILKTLIIIIEYQLNVNFEKYDKLKF